MRGTLLVLAIVLSALCGWSQDTDTTYSKPRKIVGFPAVFFTPETSLGFGAFGVYTFNFSGDSSKSRLSNIQLGGAYTLRKQWLFYMPYQVFWGSGKNLVYGQLGYYKYNYDFWGVGNSYNDDSTKETYEAAYPRIRFNYLREIVPNLFMGIRLWWEDFNINLPELESGKALDEATYTGSRGGVNGGPGVVGRYDSRNHVFSPSSGILAEAVFHYNSTELGSKFNFNRYLLDVSCFFSNQWEDVIALNVFSDNIFGDAPFNQLAGIGGPKKLRGYYENRYRDKHSTVIQGEYRLTTGGRIGGVFFAGLGLVSDAISNYQLSRARYSAGAGLRVSLNKEEGVNIRFDAGFGKNTMGFYITIGEAF